MEGAESFKTAGEGTAMEKTFDVTANQELLFRNLYTGRLSPYLYSNQLLDWVIVKFIQYLNVGINSTKRKQHL